MILVPSQEFADEEAKRDGAKLFFLHTIYPHYFRNGIAAGSGTFVNCAFVAPDRLQVNTGASSASWTSPVLRATVGAFPVTFTPTWTAVSPGYNAPPLELHTAATAAGLNAASWNALTSGTPVAISEYYQWRLTWTAVRSWFFDTEGEMDGTAMKFLDAENPSDPDQSYFTDSNPGEGVAYVQGVRFAGEYLLPEGDIKQNGSITVDANEDFADLSAGDHTLVLLNRDQRYSSRHANFIFAGETNWKKKNLRIAYGYEKPNGQRTATLPLYIGIILKWGPTPHGVGQGGKRQEHIATVYSRDAVALQMLEQKVGRAAEDGTPQPLVMGEILHQAEQLGDETLGNPDHTADFENGTTGELAAVDSGGGGTVEVVADDPYAGNYCLKTTAADAGAYARGRLELLEASAQPLFTHYLRFVTVPAAPLDKNMHFLGLYDAGGTEQIQFYVGSDFRVYAKTAAGAWKETDWYINQDQGVWLRASLGLLGTNPGVLKLWANGNEVLTWEGDWSSYSLKGAFAGPHLAAAETWEIHTDTWKIFPNFYPQLYRLAGGPFESISTVYSDGAIKIEKPLTLPPSAAAPGLFSTRSQNLQGLGVRYVGGTVESNAPANMTKVPAEGAVIFNDQANPVSGTVVFRARKDGLVHPVDQIQEVVVRVGQGDKINAAAFAAAKAANPGDSLGCYFENIPAGDAIRGIVSRCLLLFFMSGGQVKIKAYDGQTPATYELSLTEKDLVGLEPVSDDEGLKNYISAKYGWYERNHKLYYVAKDEQSINFSGLYDTELDYSYGGEVGSDNGDMVKRNTNRLLIRLKGGRERLSWSGFRNLLRLELADGVLVDSPYLGPPVIYTIMGLTFRLDSPQGVDLRLVRFLGEN